jgi:hypothetical protein
MARAKCRNCMSWCITDKERRVVGWVDRLGYAYTLKPGIEILVCSQCLAKIVYEATKDKAA